MKEIIALSGYARSGKDTAANVLVEEFGFVKVAFADKLRDLLYALNPNVGQSSPTLLQEVIDEHGWDGYKETEHGVEIRRLLQRLGTEAGREIFGENVWIDLALTNLPHDAKVVVSDARFTNELNAVSSLNGVVWRIERIGVGPINSHPSETEAAKYPFDLVLENAGTEEEFKQMIRDEYTAKQLSNWTY